MIVDSSAVLALLFQEPDAAWFAAELAGADRLFMSPVNQLEVAIVITVRKGDAGLREWDLLKLQAGIESVPFTEALEELAADIWRRFGKGRGQASIVPARLNMGDCCAAALAVTSGHALLTKDAGFAAAAAAGGKFSVRIPLELSSERSAEGALSDVLGDALDGEPGAAT
jgi:ribonuclease VapC